MHKIYVTPGKDRETFDVTYEGQPLLSGVRDPEPMACRELLRRGLKGSLLSHFNGTPSLRMMIERDATPERPSE